MEIHQEENTRDPLHQNQRVYLVVRICSKLTVPLTPTNKQKLLLPSPRVQELIQEEEM